MIRLFVALELPGHVRDALLGTMGGVIGARWQTDEQLHLTLRFIGEVDRHRATDVVAALGHVRVQPFTATLGEPGSFAHRGRIDSLWVGVRPAEELTALARRIDRALSGVGLPPDGRAFVPHVTVARGRGLAVPQHWPQVPVPALAWRVDGFALWESQLSPAGSAYRVAARWRG